ncbi:uncharacterized protein LOC121812690 [Haplochromis burtoni]|uniref:uncharacterized protein LOC121812690 n=1 Tax=Haplochromis burtoni TaxID=8153 RepID=UPI001C2D3203|nr:uncharacterized protein LOC121812690 [Haplochromis burtoni]
MFLFFFSAPTIHLLQSVSIVIVGDDLTLPCENVTHGQDDCNSTTWAFSGSTDTAVVELATHGQIHKDVRAKSARLSVSEDCSLVINKVTVEDAGRYTCRQIKSGNEVSEFDVYLSVINTTQHDNGNKAILSCSLLAYKPCTYIVEWLYEGEENIYTDMKILPGSCSSAVTFKSQLNQKSKIYESLKCNVTDESSNKVKLFPFSSQSSGWSWEHIIFPALVAVLVAAVVMITRKKTRGNMEMDQQNNVSFIH